MKTLGLAGLEEYPLEETAALLKLTLRAAQAGSWAWDIQTGEAFWSEEYHCLVGTTPESCRPSLESWLRTIHPEDRERACQELQRAVGQRELYLEYRVLRPDGTVLWVGSKGQTLYSADGTARRMLGINFDITERRVAEQALLRREEELRVITDGIPALVSYVDAQQRYRFNNRRYEEYFALPRGAVTGRPVREILGESAYAEVRPHIEAALAGQEVSFQLWLDYQTAGAKCIEARYIPDIDSQGRVLGFFALVSDITAQRWAEDALRHSEERFRTAVDNMLDSLGIYSTVRDAEGRIHDFHVEYVNAAACASNRMSSEEQIGRLLCEILPSHRDSELFQDYCRVVETGEPLIRETVAYEDSYGGERLRRTFDLRVARLGDGIVAAWRDVTVIKQRETVLQEADRHKDEFLAMLAHELRNPLGSIRNAVEVQRHLNPLDPRVRRMRDVIQRQSDQLTRLVEDLLDVSRISQGKLLLRQEGVNLAALVARAVETSRPLIDAGGHQLTVSLPDEAVTLEGDLFRLAQAVSNLLNNAAKYTERGGNIWLTAEIEDGEILLRVKDDGIGIPAHVLPHVFDLFAQAELSCDRAQGGLGIGLTLVKNIVEMHGGKVAAFSPGPGQGSEILLRLPWRAAAPEAAPAEAATEAPPTVPRRILVVDDNVDSAESLALLLEMGGHEVRTAYYGPSAIEVGKAFQPQVVLLDIGLPGLDGYQVARLFREELGLRQAVLIALTGYGQAEDRQKSVDAGIDHHLTKPVAYEALRTLIQSLPAAEMSAAGSS
jgi:PAS domain S-box-containing protein